MTFPSSLSLSTNIKGETFDCKPIYSTGRLAVYSTHLLHRAGLSLFLLDFLSLEVYLQI